MPVLRPSPLRGLLAGLLVLMSFAWAAVAMAAGGSSTGRSPALIAQTVVQGDAARITGGGDEAHGRGDDGDGHP